MNKEVKEPTAKDLVITVILFASAGVGAAYSLAGDSLFVYAEFIILFILVGIFARFRDARRFSLSARATALMLALILIFFLLYIV